VQHYLEVGSMFGPVRKGAWAIVAVWIVQRAALGQQELAWPPRLPGGKELVTVQSPELLRAPGPLLPGTAVAKTPPRVDVLYYPRQDYPGKPWSNWGDSLFAGGKFYSAIGDHLAPNGNAYVYEYDPQTQKLRCVVSLQDILKIPQGHYAPGKIHSRLDLGSDGWLYFSTHRGSTRVTSDQYHYQGDWILRYHPQQEVTEIVCQAPAGKQCIPTSVLDPERLIFYGGTAPATGEEGPNTFFAYDVKNRKLLHASKPGAYRYFIFARSTGRVYYTPSDDEPLRRFDPAVGKPELTETVIGLRAATQETPQGIVYTVSRDGVLYAFDVKTEKARELGSALVGTQGYITTLDADPTGRYLYYAPGAHGGAYRDGTPVVQYDTKTGQRKVIAFLHPVLQKETGWAPIGTYGLAVDDTGSRIYVAWNGNRGGERRGRLDFDTCAMTVIHVPESERPAE
jgi:hypothetical protein